VSTARYEYVFRVAVSGHHPRASVAQVLAVEHRAVVQVDVEPGPVVERERVAVVVGIDARPRVAKINLSVTDRADLGADHVEDESGEGPALASPAWVAVFPVD
jgi:hypothetical protein